MLGPGLSLEGVPLSVEVHDPAREPVRPLFAALFAADVLPVGVRQPGQTPAQFIRAGLKKWSQEHSPYLKATLTPDGEALHARIEMYEPIAYNLDDFHDALGSIHPRLSGSVLAQVKAAGRGGWEFFTHADACDWHLSGNQKAFWQRTRAEACAAWQVEADTLTNTQLRAYVKKHQVITPGVVRQKLGKNVVLGLRRPLNHAQITRLLRRRPQQAQAYRELREVLAAYTEHSHMLRCYGADQGGVRYGALLDADPDQHEWWTPLQEIFWHARADAEARVEATVTAGDPEELHNVAAAADYGVHLLHCVMSELSGWPVNVWVRPQCRRAPGAWRMGSQRKTPERRDTVQRRNP